MYSNITDEFSRVHAETGRYFSAKLTLSLGAVFSIDGGDILSLKLLRGNSSADDITFGDVSAATVSMELTYYASTMASLKDGMTAYLSIGLQLSSSVEYAPMGVFKVLSFKKNGEKITLNMADKLYDSDTMYKSALIYPNTADNVVAEICNELGITAGYEAEGIDLSEMSFSAAPSNVTKRQMLSYIASYFGKNAYIGRIGQLVFGFYDFDSPVQVTDDEIDTPTVGDAAQITALACAVDSNTTLTSGEGRALTFTNPYMTQSRLDSLRRDISYYPCEIKQLVGSILLDFDVLSYDGCLIPIMSSELIYDGGVSLDIKAVGLSEEEASAKTVTAFDIMLEQVRNYASDAIKKATETLNGVNGGYKIDRVDADGKPYATLWMNAPTELAATNCIMINKAGIGFGKKNANETEWTFTDAWTIDGNFNTEFIKGKRIEVLGTISDSQDGIVNDDAVELHYEISSELELPIVNDATIQTSGVKAWSDTEGLKSKTFYSNWGLFFDNSEIDATTVATFLSILAYAGNCNFVSNAGFMITENNSDGSTDSIYGTPGGGLNATQGIYDNSYRCLTVLTGALNGMADGYLEDCDYPTADENNRVSFDAFSGETANIPWANSVGYIITLRDESDRHIVQFAVRYRDNQIKMRVYNRADTNSNSDGTTPAWENWSSHFVLGDSESSFDTNEKSDNYLQGYEISPTGVMTQWGQATVSTSGTTITFPKAYSNKNYSISISSFGKISDTYFSMIDTTGFKITAEKDDSIVRWTTIGLR